MIAYSTTSIFVMALIVPQIALAAWWNPLSWNIFHRTDTKTQILENRVKELEKKLESTATSTSTTATTTKQSQTKATVKSVEKVAVPASLPKKNNNLDLLIEKCKAENSKWLAAWPSLEQSIRDKVRSDYQSAIWSYMQQYKGVVTAGDIASSTSSLALRQEQQAVSVAKTKFDLAGNEAYQKCLSTIQN